MIETLFGEPAMTGPLKTEPFREIGGRLPQGGLAFSAVITLIAMVAFGPVLPRPGLWPVVSSSSGATPDSDDESNWAGHLQRPGQAPTMQSERLTSASYTSGFDKVAEGVVPTKPKSPKPQARDPQACPGDLNCAFRAAKSATLPPRRPILVATAPVTTAPTDAVMPASAGSITPAPADASPPPAPSALPLQLGHGHDFGALLPRLPSPHTLLKPFTFVADQFTGLIKKL